MEMTQFFSEDGLKRVGEVLFQSGKDFFNDNGPQWAAAIAYYTLLSIFPLMLAAASIAAYFVDPKWAIQQGTSLIGNFLPGGESQIRQVVEGAIQARGQVGFFSILTLLWSGSRVFGAITKALNTAYDISDLYGFLKRVLVEVLMMLSIGVLLILALSSQFLLGFLTNAAGVSAGQSSWLFSILKITLRPALLIVTVFLIYEYVPRRRVTWWASLVGAVVFTIFFLIAQPLFTGYIHSFASYNLIYGPLAVVVILVLWTWIVADILLLGGELVSHIQDMWIEHKSGQEVEERHEARDPTRPKHDE